MVKRLALVLAIILALALYAFKTDDIPKTVGCYGSVPVPAQLKGLRLFNDVGAGVHVFAMPIPEGEIRRVVQGMWIVFGRWWDAFADAANGRGLSAFHEQQEQSYAEAQRAHDDGCKPCLNVSQQTQSIADEQSAALGASFQSGSTLTGKAAARAAAARYWSGRDLDIAVAIAGAESTYNPRAVNPAAGGNYGLWQINSVHRALLASGNRFAPADNARMAFEVWKGAGRRWTPWSVYNSGSYKRFLPASQQDSTQPNQNLDDPRGGGEGGSGGSTPGSDCGGGPNADVATWNVLFTNGRADVLAGVKAIAGQGASLIGLQEAGRYQKDLPSMAGWSKTNDGTENPILWKRSAFELVAEGHQQAYPAGSDLSVEGGRVAMKFITWVQLRDKSTGSTFYYGNTHTVYSIEEHGQLTRDEPKRTRLFTEHLQLVADLTAKWRAENQPVIWTGDWNAVPSNKALAGAMSRAGLISNWSTLGILPTHETRTIDTVWSSGAAPRSQRTLGRYGSDHKAVMVSFAANQGSAGLASPAAMAGTRTVTDPSSGKTYRVPIPAGKAGVAVNFALDQLGEPYVFGSQGPNTWDCSGLVSKAWAAAGEKVYPQTEVLAREEPAAVGKKAGDLLYHPGHVQMYLFTTASGRDVILEAPRTGLKVRIVPQWMNPTKRLRPDARGASA